MFSKNTQMSNFTKILPVGTELLHADGQADVTKPIVVFRNFSNAFKSRLARVVRILGVIFHFLNGG